MKKLELDQMAQTEGGVLVLLCAAGGPVTLGICLTVALVLISSAAY